MPQTMKGQAQTVTRNVELEGLRPIMFDAYPGDNVTELRPEDKLYLKDGCLVLPTENLMSFLTAVNTTSAPKRLLDSREYGRVCSAFQSFVDIEPADCIQFLRDKKPIAFGKFDGVVDEKSGIRIDKRVARLSKGIPNPKERPVLYLPWSLAFQITLYKNREASEQLLLRMFEEGGVTVGLGTFRGRYGKFAVKKWK